MSLLGSFDHGWYGSTPALQLKERLAKDPLVGRLWSSMGVDFHQASFSGSQHMHIHIYIHISMYVYKGVYTYIYICMHTYVRAYVYLLVLVRCCCSTVPAQVPSESSLESQCRCFRVTPHAKIQGVCLFRHARTHGPAARHLPSCPSRSPGPFG